MAEFARLPTRQKVMVFALIGGLLLLLYWQFVYKGLKRDLEAADNENASLQQLNRKLEKDIPEFEALKQRMVTLKRIIDENQKALPTEAELPAFFETLNRKVLESGVEVIRSKQLAEQPVESFIKVPIEYEIQGTYVQIKKFFASLVPKRRKPGQQETLPGGEQAVEERERIVSIENLSLQNPAVRNRELRLSARFIASTYRQEERGGPPPPKPAPAPAKTTPPKSTPAGAKAATEKSLDDGAKRSAGSAVKPGGVERMKEGK